MGWGDAGFSGVRGVCSIVVHALDRGCARSRPLRSIAGALDRRSVKPSRDVTCPLGMPRGLKGLLHMINAIVHSMKEGFILFF
jgi:hypothetical protein